MALDTVKPPAALQLRVRWRRAAIIGTTLGILIIPLVRLALSLESSMGVLGVDQHLYRESALRFVSGEGYFFAHQLAGPYIPTGEPLYPPIILWLLVPFAYLPGLLWWAVPTVLYVWALWRIHPTGWAIPATAAMFALSPTIDMWWLGQPTIWLPAFVALGLMHGGLAALVFLKPALLPFAFIGVTRRSWWATVAVLAALALPFGTLWPDWLTAITNSGGGLLYSLYQVPMLLVPVVAWFGRRQSAKGEPFALPTPDAYFGRGAPKVTMSSPGSASVTVTSRMPVD